MPLAALFDWITPTGKANDTGKNPGRGADDNTPFVASIELNEQGHPLRMKLSVVKGFKYKVIAQCSKRYIKQQTIVMSDRLACFQMGEHHYR